MSIIFRPKYISFDCYGTLIYFQMAPVARKLFADRIKPEDMDQFCKDFSSFRLDEVLGDWQPYYDVVYNAVLRTANRWKVPFREADVAEIYAAVPTWGPHPDVVEGLARIADKIPLVILSNAMDAQLVHNVEKLKVPFHRVYTAQQAKAYKPRMRPFEYMIQQLNAKPEDFLHVSSSMRYDLMTAHDIGIKDKAFVNRGHEPGTPFYNYAEIADIGGLAGLVGL
ncbi:haloacid dehalogenase type II [Pseudoduganella namucuonensis]|uniref:2-haloacid dehalogenase n=1 Tax=Pseudoduganella namucuonensis TaxID=1035707 RepID=A0A1I7K1Y5_9BURK|nr:haloacid dehalogenase type II [Pseudoduganella namucuonensis]SFU91400.1 2-haloacid dehalogenase [Pseudoduganella namucuonensis]